MILKNFTVFEGIDGAGTSTQMMRLQKKLHGKPAVFTAEPSDSPVGVFIRTLLQGAAPVSPETMARLFAADRQEHLSGTDGIMASIKGGKAVFSDRYLFSSLAYQHDTENSGLLELVQLENKMFPLPAIVFYFKIRPEVSLKRICSRSVIEIYEKQDILTRVAARYTEIFNSYAKTYPDMRIVEIDAEKSPDDIEKIIWSTICEMPIIKET